MSNKHSGPRLVNPSDQPVKEAIPYKTIIVTTVVSGTAGFLLAKILEHFWESGKKMNPFANNKMGNPMMGPMGQPQHAFQSPYSHMAHTQGLPFPPPEAPMPQVSDDAPPKWAQAFIAAHDQRLTKIEQRMGPKVVSEDDAA